MKLSKRVILNPKASIDLSSVFLNERNQQDLQRNAIVSGQYLVILSLCPTDTFQFS